MSAGLYRQALTAHQAGRLAEAAASFNLAKLLEVRGRFDEATELLATLGVQILNSRRLAPDSPTAPEHR